MTAPEHPTSHTPQDDSAPEESSQPAAEKAPAPPRGEKRWGVEPDWSKLPSTPRRRQPIDVPEWGASSIDARNLVSADGNANQSSPQDAAPAWQTPDFQEMTRPGAEPVVAEVHKPAAPTQSAPVASAAVAPDTVETESVGPGSDATTSALINPAQNNGGISTTEERPAASLATQSRSASLSDFDDLPFWDEEPDDPYDGLHPSASATAPRSITTEKTAATETTTAKDAATDQADSSEQSPDEPNHENLRDDAERILKRLVGRDDVALREDQWQAIEALVARAQRVLVVQRTGWGKSAVYFVATAILRASGAGPTVIISPLLALMRDQIAAAERAGIRAVTINSANVTEWDHIHEQIAQGEVDVLLCSPERLNNPDFRDQVLPKLSASAGLVVVDEAHCISDWGHDFRPDYRRIRTLIEELPPRIPVLATTATANERVTRDVAEQLAVTHAQSVPTPQVLVLRGSLDRESLQLAVLPVTDQPTRVAWLLNALSTLPGSGIVYCLTVAAAEQVAEQLRANGLPVQAYTGRTDPAERESLEADLKANRVKALIATSALGMGFDKPDLSFVIHLGAPSSPIAYYQQVGRAGRAVDSATVVLAPGVEDQQIWDYFGSLAFPDEPRVRAVLDALKAHGTQSAARLETQVDLRRSRLEMMLKVLDVDDVVRRVRGGWEATGKAWEYDAERYARVARAREDEQRTMLEYEATPQCRMAFLRATLDDPVLEEGWRCGRCDRCTTPSLPALPDADAINAARSEMDRPGVEIAPRRMWPSGMQTLGVELSGKIAPSEVAEAGRAIGRLDGLGWSAPLRNLFATETADGPVPVALRKAAARVLDDWEQEAQIDGIVWVSSSTRPVLVEHLASGLASYLGKPVVGSVEPRAGHEPGRHDINSAMRLAGVSNRLDLNLTEAAAAGLPSRNILLVDDFTDSGWTLTTAARLIRRAGAAGVLPFVLAIR